MLKILPITLFFCLLGSWAVAQNPIFETIQTKKNAGERFASVAPFQKPQNRQQDATGAESPFVTLQLEKKQHSAFHRNKPNNVAFSIPYKGNDIQLELTKVQVTTEDFKVKEAASGKTLPVKVDAVFYRGIVAGKPNSLVSLAVFDNEISGVISDPEKGNLNLGKKDRQDPVSDEYAIYSDKEAGVSYQLDCGTEDSFGESVGVQERGGNVGGCINVSLEAEYEFYTNNGSNVGTVVNGLLSVFNVTKAIFDYETINMQVSEVLVWTVPDPYATGAATLVTLPQFASNRGANFNGNLAHLIRWGGIQGRAYLDGLCSENTYFGVSHFNSFDLGTYMAGSPPTGYSGPAFVLAHELGHNLGSPHTHACAWNGNNTAIDACSATEGGCATTPAGAPASNTIMSYCNAVNFANGFGTHPGNLIRAVVTSKTCLSAGPCVANTCVAPADLSVTGFPATGSAALSWTTDVSHTGGYNIRSRTQGTAGWTTVTTSAPPYTLTGLNPGNVYEVEVQGICAGGGSDYISGVIFSECPPPTNQTETVSGTSATFNWTENNGATSWEVKYGNTGFNVNTEGTLVSPISGSPTTMVSGLNNGNCYQWYVRSACASSSSGFTAWVGPKDFGTSPTNDNIANAQLLTVGAGAETTSNCGATKQTSEPNPATPTGRWNSAMDQTVWFKFVAPSSGNVVVTTDFTQTLASEGGNDDPQLALYQGPAGATNFTGFVMLQSDEDDGEIDNGYNNILTFSGLTPGDTYYVQADGWGSTQGVFKIQVLEQVETFQATSTCTAYTAIGTNGATVNRWYSVYNTTDPNTPAQLVGAVKSAQNLGNITLKVNQNAASNPATGIHIAGQYYDIQSSNAPNGTTDVFVRLIFRENDLNALKAPSATGNTALTINDINVLHYSGTNEDCNFANNTSYPTGYETKIPTRYTVPEFGGTEDVYVLEFAIKTFSELVPVVSSAALPLELLSLKAYADRSVNQIQWETATETGVKWHLIERSADGLANWSEIGRKDGQAYSTEKRAYQLTDPKPLAQSYYRLRSIDENGKENLSAIVLVNRQREQFHIQSVFPLPAPETVNVKLFVPKEGDVRYALFDMTGRLVQDGIWAALGGIQDFPISMGTFASGCYQLVVTDGEGVQQVARVIK